MISHANRKVCMSFRQWLKNESPCPQGWQRAEAMGMSLPTIWAAATRPSDMLWLVNRMPGVEWASHAIGRIINEHSAKLMMTAHPEECFRCCDDIRDTVPIECLPPFVGKFLTDRQQSKIRQMLRDGEL